jgi:hypothetical protein
MSLRSDFLGPELIRRTNYQGDPYHVMRNELKIGKEPDYGEGTPVPATSDLGELRKKAAKCQACPLFRNATQTVFGEGGAGVVFIGEQPGDQEDKVASHLSDRRGKYWIGP